MVDFGSNAFDPLGCLVYSNSKRKKAEVLSYGLLLGILSSQLDEIGISFGAWSYPYQLIQLNRGLNPYNFSLIPSAYMIVYNYFPKWKNFLVGNIIVALIAAFIFGPILEKVGIYKPFYWKSIYSFPIYILLPIIFRYVIYFALQKNKK
jgi:hypothetical protein